MTTLGPDSLRALAKELRAQQHSADVFFATGNSPVHHTEVSAVLVWADALDACADAWEAEQVQHRNEIAYEGRENIYLRKRLEAMTLAAYFDDWSGFADLEEKP